MIFLKVYRDIWKVVMTFLWEDIIDHLIDSGNKRGTLVKGLLIPITALILGYGVFMITMFTLALIFAFPTILILAIQHWFFVPIVGVDPWCFTNALGFWLLIYSLFSLSNYVDRIVKGK